MDALELLAYMVKEEHTALDKLLDKMSEDQLNQPLVKGRENSTIGKRLAHIVEAEYRMATYLYQEDDDVSEFSVDEGSLEDIKDKSIVSKNRHLKTLNNLSQSDFNKVWTSEKSGNSYEYKFLLWHFIEHISTHRGQVAMALNS